MPTGYKGELSLVPESLSVTESRKESYSYTVKDTKYFEDLENKDWALIPKTTQKNGLILALQDVDWQATDGETAGYSEIPTSYTAIAKYSAVASEGHKANILREKARYVGIGVMLHEDGSGISVIQLYAK